jgi:hypothetical protein
MQIVPEYFQTLLPVSTLSPALCRPTLSRTTANGSRSALGVVVKTFVDAWYLGWMASCAMNDTLCVVAWVDRRQP